MACCSRLSQIFLVTFNTLLLLAGLVPLVIGVIALVSEDTIQKLVEFIPGTEKITDIVDLQDLISSFAIAFVVFGAIVSVIAFLGCCGACCKIRCMQILYLILILLILLAEIALVIIAVAYPDTFSKGGEELFRKGFKDITDIKYIDQNRTWDLGETTSLAWHTMQFELFCCGPSGVSDYDVNSAWKTERLEAIAPASCCLHVTKELEKLEFGEIQDCYVNGTTAEWYNSQGCFDALVDEAVKSAIFIGVMAGIGALEIIIIITAIVGLCKNSKKNNVA